MSVESQSSSPDEFDEHTDYLCRKGRYVVIGFWTKLPQRCFVCNKEASYGEDIEYDQLNNIEVFFCQEHIKKRKRQFKFIVAYAAVSILFLIMAGFLNSPDSGKVAFVATLLIPILCLPYSLTAKFKQRRIWIKGAGKEFLKSLPECDA